MFFIILVSVFYVVIFAIALINFVFSFFLNDRKATFIFGAFTVLILVNIILYVGKISSKNKSQAAESRYVECVGEIK